MLTRGVLSAAVLVLVVGCATPPSVNPAARDPLGRVPLDALTRVPLTAAAVQINPAIEGTHPAEFYVDWALQLNPEIRALERRVAARNDRIPQVTALPDPMLSDTFWPISNTSPQTAAGRVTNGVTLSQQFPWYSKLRLRGEVADLEAKIALTELAAAQLKVAEEVKQSYYDIYFNQEAITITEKNEKLVEEYVQIARSLYKVGKTSLQDVLRAQVELSNLHNQLIGFRRGLETSRADLAKSLATSPKSDLKAAAPKPLSVPKQIDRLYEVAVASRPELQGRLQAVLRDQRQIELARQQYYPDVNVGVAWNAVTAGGALARMANGNDQVGFVVGINLPVWTNKIQAGIREAENRTAESALLLQSSRDDTLRLIRRYIAQAQALEEQITLFRDEIIPRAQQTLDASVADYKVGKVSFIQLIDNWSQLLRFQLQLVRMQAALGQALASLERVIGAELARPSEPSPPVNEKAIPAPRPLPN